MQACADDPQVAFHAVRNLARHRPRHRGRALVAARLRPDVLDEPRAGHAAQPDGLQGRHRQPQGRGPGGDARARVGRRRPPASRAWLRGGTYLVARRIRMLIEAWDRASLDDQEETIGRHKASGAPLGAARRVRPRCDPARLPADSHVRLAAPQANGGARLLRRGYSFTDGLDDALGQLDAGLFFLASSATRRVRRHPAPARRQRRAQRVHPARRLRRVGDPAGRAPRRMGGGDAARRAGELRRRAWSGGAQAACAATPARAGSGARAPRGGSRAAHRGAARGRPRP